jgi:hypothetical protein
MHTDLGAFIFFLMLLARRHDVPYSPLESVSLVQIQERVESTESRAGEELLCYSFPGID